MTHWTKNLRQFRVIVGKIKTEILYNQIRKDLNQSREKLPTRYHEGLNRMMLFLD